MLNIHLNAMHQPLYINPITLTSHMCLCFPVLLNANHDDTKIRELALPRELRLVIDL